jgi:glucose-6-phosphate 1-dehydrogenase
LAGAKLLDDGFSVLGVGRDVQSDEDYRAKQTESMESFTPAEGGEFAEKSLDQENWGWLRGRLHYQAGDFTKLETFAEIGKKIGDGNAVFYLTVADRFFGGLSTRSIRRN